MADCKECEATDVPEIAETYDVDLVTFQVIDVSILKDGAVQKTLKCPLCGTQFTASSSSGTYKVAPEAGSRVH